MSAAVLEPAVLPLDDPRWRRFVAECVDSTPFHRLPWAELLMHAYGFPGFAVAVCGSDGRLTAGAPFLEVRSVSRRRRWISLPFTDACPPLSEAPAARAELTKALAAVQVGHRGPTVEVRGAIADLGWRSAAGAVTHELELGEGIEDARRRVSRAVIRNIARARREGVTVRRADSTHDLQAFYALHTRTRRRQGVPVQPRRFFELLWSRLVKPGVASILLADVGGKEAVAGALFLSGGGTTIYKFGASDPESWPHRPNHLILWTALEEACARGDRRFDYGRTDLGNEGLRAFKRNWGAQERLLVYSTLAPGAATGVEGLLTRTLSVAIRNGPEWMCRGVGETLYRYSASR